MNEKEKISSILKGNKDAFEELFRTHYALLCGYANKFLPDPASSEEIVQDVFCNLWEKRSQLQIQTSLPSYLYASVRNRCLNEIRRRKKYDKNSEGEDLGVQDRRIEEMELDQRIEEAISNLPESARKVFEMSRFEGKKYKEIAEELNISLKAVEGNMSRALKKLREELREFLIGILLFLMS